MHKFLSIDLSLLQGSSSEESGFIILLAYLNIMEKKLRTWSLAPRELQQYIKQKNNPLEMPAGK